MIDSGANGVYYNRIQDKYISVVFVTVLRRASDHPPIDGTTEIKTNGGPIATDRRSDSQPTAVVNCALRVL